MDLIQEKIKLRPTPLTWPVGEAGDFRGVLDRRTGEFVKYTRTAGGATRAPEQRMALRRGRGARRAAVGRGGRGARAAHPRRRRPRPGALPGRGDDARHVRLGPAELRCRAAAGPAARRRAGAQPDRGCRRLGPPGRRRVQRVRLQGAVRDEQRPPRPARLRPGGVRHVRARHGRHPRHHRAALRDEVRPGGLRPRDDVGRDAPSPATSSASSTRRPSASGTRSTSATPSSTRPCRASRPSTS